MTFEQIVRDYERLKYQIRRLEIKEKELRLLGGFPKAGGLDGMPKIKSNSSAVENLVIKLNQISEDKKSFNLKISEKRKEILKLIDNVSSLSAQEIIELKTFSSRIGWKQIADNLFLSESHCRRLYYLGLSEINKKQTEEKVE